jgi:hypothetical protein
LQSFARMAELVDALVSGTSARKGVQVRVLFRVLEFVFGYGQYSHPHAHSHIICPGGEIGRHTTLRG